MCELLGHFNPLRHQKCRIFFRPMASPGPKVPRTTQFGISARNTLKLVNTLVMLDIKEVAAKTLMSVRLSVVAMKMQNAQILMEVISALVSKVITATVPLVRKASAMIDGARLIKNAFRQQAIDVHAIKVLVMMKKQNSVKILMNVR